LVVDDDPDIRRLVATYLSGQGYRVTTAANGARMREVLADRPVDLVILDLGLPGEDGLELARALRAESDVGIIMLTGHGDLLDRVTGLEIGADDYLTKPVSLRELLARERSVLRRQGAVSAGSAEGAARSPAVARFAEWRLDLNTRELTDPDGKIVPLTTAEFRLLAAFVTSPRRPLDRDHLLGLVAEREWTPYDRSVDVLIGKLRQKIEPDPKTPSLIKTERGLGYVFLAEVELS
jgi:DNA-binding response OmpR family regulator